MPTDTQAVPIPLEQVLADLLGDAAVLRRRGHARDAELMERVVHQVRTSTTDFLEWLDESQAAARAGWTLTKVRRLIRQFAGTEHVRYDRRRTLVRAVLIPRTLPASVLREAGAQGSHDHAA